MHELSIARALAETVTSALRSENATGRVREVHLRVGVLAGVVPDALAFCYDIAIQGTPLEGSALIVRHVPAAGRCGTCEADVVLDGGVLLTCPNCARPVTALTGGRELEVSHLVLDDDIDGTRDASDAPGYQPVPASHPVPA